MFTLTITTFRSNFLFSLFLLALPLSAHASLPKASNVPGGVAIVQIGSTATLSSKPRIMLGNQPVLVTAERKKWVAVVGIPLDTKMPHGAD